MSADTVTTAASPEEQPQNSNKAENNANDGNTTPTPPLTGRAKNLAALAAHRFRPGCNPNPAGSGRHNWSADSWLRHMLKAKTRKIYAVQAQKMLGTPSAKLAAEENLWQRVYMHAANGNAAMARMIMEYRYGKPAETLNVTTTQAQPIILMREVVPDGKPPEDKPVEPPKELGTQDSLQPAG